jgi:hypothetical protein
MAKKSHPKIQIYTLSEEDLIIYYKKLTKFQRDYSSRISKYQSRVKSKSLKSNLDSIQKSLMSREPWYTIPKNLVISEENWEHSVEINYLSELSQTTDDPINDLLLIAKGYKSLDEVNLETLKWDPNIPTDVQDKILICDMVHLYTASQFSNCGVIPLLEYYSREEQIPITRLLGRHRLPSMVTERLRLSSLLSRFYHKPRKKVKEITYEEDLFFEEEYVEIDWKNMDASKFNIDRSAIDEFLKERNLEPKSITIEHTQERDDQNDKILQLASGLKDRLGMGAYINEYFGVQDTVDVFGDDNGSDGEDMFSMFD